jgi:hypothetical protein
MSGKDDVVGCKFETPITFVLGRVAKEHAQGGARGKFMGCGGGHVRVTSTPKNFKMVIGWRFGVKGGIGGGVFEGFGGESIH